MAGNSIIDDRESQIALSREHKKKHEASMKTRRIVGNVVVYAILSIMVVIWLLPIVWLLLQSFNSQHGSAGMQKLIPTQFGFDNYYELFNNVYYEGGKYLDSAYLFFARVNNGRLYLGSFFYTLFIAAISAVISTLFVMMTSYAFSRLRFKSRQMMMKAILLLGMFPGFLSLIVLYEIFKMWKMTGTIWSLIIIYSGGAGMGYYISKGFFDTISKQIDEAAMIDGASRFQIFYKITLPLSKPIVVYQVITAFMGPWAEYITAGYLLRSPQNFKTGTVTTVAVQLKDMLRTEDGTRGRYWGQFCAAAVIIAIPTSILFIIMQKNYVSGVTGGAVKG
ncbi:MAG: sugar ABC transporter permease [Candidatus Enteromonas sp.]|nr:sugar ABC transporter permease [Candidatus Enteromonas sp.]